MKLTKFKYLFIGLSVLTLPLASCVTNSISTYYTFNLIVEGEGGEIQGTTSGEYLAGYAINLTAIIYDEETTTFDGYYENDGLISDELILTINLNRDLSLVAKFTTSETINDPIEVDNEYYTDFDFTLTGDALRNELNEKNQVQTKVSYGDARSILLYADESIDDPGYVYLIYDGADYVADWGNGQTINREHVWCCSHMGIDTPSNNTTNHGSDLHNLRLSYATTNSSRGNKFYGNTTNSNYYYPNIGTGDHRGDVARILFYMYCTYPQYCTDIVENPTSGNNVMGVLSVLLDWNEADPVDEFEKQRNDRIYEYQGNRNPFIDYPTLATQLFS